MQLIVLYDKINKNIVRDIGQQLIEVIIVALKERTCCFLGHRKIDFTEELISRLKEIVEDLITEKKVDTFLFGSKSEFVKLCLKVIRFLKLQLCDLTSSLYQLSQTEPAFLIQQLKNPELTETAVLPAADPKSGLG